MSFSVRPGTIWLVNAALVTTLPPIPLPSEPPILRGVRVLLRSIRPQDQQDRLAYGRDPEFHRLVGGAPERASHPLTEADVQRWYAQLRSEPLYWVVEAEGRMIGTARLHALDTHHRRARYAVGLFSPEHRGRGYGEETTRTVLSYAFGALRLHRVELRVLEFNTRAIQMYERCGFVREGREREGVLLGGVWHSDVLMSILEHEFAPVPRA